MRGETINISTKNLPRSWHGDMALIPAMASSHGKVAPCLPTGLHIYIHIYTRIYISKYLRIYMADIMDFAKNPSEMALYLPISLYTVLYLDTYLVRS
jgi:hypothetical protein